jgi:hypothetical protein
MENQLENEIHKSAVNAQHRLGTELSLIFACCYKLRQTSDSVLSGDQIMLLEQIQKSAEAIRDLRTDLTADGDEF